MVKTVKIALLATAAAGAVAAGGVTYASVGNPMSADKPAAAKHLPSKAPAAPAQPSKPNLPTCAPSAQVPTGKLPKADVPKNKIPENKLPANGDQHVNVQPKPKLPAGSEAPSTLPSCLPKAKDPKKLAAKPRSAKPAAPEPGELSCAKVPPAVTLGGSFERTVTTPRGLTYSASHTASVTFEGRKVCVVAQKWVGKGGQYLTVEHLKSSARLSPEQLRQALSLPTGVKATVDGHDAWQSPLGDGELWVGKNGYGFYVGGSPSFSGQLGPIVAQLRQMD